MSKSKFHIELEEKEKIDPNDIDGDGKPDEVKFDQLYDGEGFERDPNNFEFISKKKRTPKKKGILLNLGNGLRFLTNGISKYFLGPLVGNEASPIPKLVGIKMSWIYIVVIIIETILLVIK